MSSILDWRLLTELLLRVPCVVVSNVLFYFNIWYIMMDNMLQIVVVVVVEFTEYQWCDLILFHHLLVFTIKKQKQNKNILTYLFCGKSNAVMPEKRLVSLFFFFNVIQVICAKFEVNHSLFYKNMKAGQVVLSLNFFFRYGPISKAPHGGHFTFRQNCIMDNWLWKTGGHLATGSPLLWCEWCNSTDDVWQVSLVNQVNYAMFIVVHSLNSFMEYFSKTHTDAHNGFLVASTVSCNSINNFSSGESPRRCVQSFMQIGEIAWEEFEKVGLWHFTNLEEKKCVCGRWYKIFECVMWCKSRMTIDYDIFSAGVMYIRLLSFGVCSGSERSFGTKKSSLQKQ